MTFVRAWRALLAAFALIVLLAGCGSEKSDPPRLAALPTRTTSPVTPTPESAAPRSDALSLVGVVQTFLDRAESLAPLDQSLEFITLLHDSGQGCFSDPTATGEDIAVLFDLTAIQLPVIDPTAWQQSVTDAPEADFLTRAATLLADFEDRQPTIEPLHACLLPVPPFAEDALLPYLSADEALRVLVPNGGMLLVTCADGTACLDALDSALARGYALAYQLQQQSISLANLSVLGRVIAEGRASAFAREILPDVVFPWDGNVGLADEAAARAMLNRALQRRYFESINALIFGRAGGANFPAWGGLVLGERIVDAYRASHPGVTWEALAALPVDIVLADSGYDMAADAP